MATLICCKDTTCKSNRDGYCNRAFVDMEVTEDYTHKTILMCMNYEDGRDGSDRKQNGS